MCRTVTAHVSLVLCGSPDQGAQWVSSTKALPAPMLIRNLLQEQVREVALCYLMRNVTEQVRTYDVSFTNYDRLIRRC